MNKKIFYVTVIETLKKKVEVSAESEEDAMAEIKTVADIVNYLEAHK